MTRPVILSVIVLGELAYLALQGGTVAPSVHTFVDDVLRWVFYGVMGWVGFQTWSNGNALSYLKGAGLERAAKIDDLDKRLVRVEGKIEAMPERVLAARDQAIDRVQEVITNMETRVQDLVETIEGRVTKQIDDLRHTKPKSRR